MQTVNGVWIGSTAAVSSNPKFGLVLKEKQTSNPESGRPNNTMLRSSR